DEINSLQAGRDHVVDGIAASTADTEHGKACLHLANVGDASHVCLTSWVVTCRPCGLPPLWTRLDVPIGVQVVFGRWPLGRWFAEPPARLQAVLLPPSPPQSRQSPGAAPPSGGLRAHARARSLFDDSPPLFRAARSPPAMSRFLSLAQRCCPPGECLGVGVCAGSRRDRRSPGLCRPARVSVAIRLA